MMEVFAKTSEGFQLLIIFAKSPVIAGSQGRNYNSASTLTKTKSKVWRKAYHICVKHMQLPLLIHDFFYLLLQNKLKSSQKDKVRSFINITNTGEKTAIHCLSCHDWRLEVATDNYFQNPEKYYKEVKTTVDKKKLTNLYEKYKDKGMYIYYCVCVKRITLCNCLCSSCYCFSASFIGNTGNSEQKIILQTIEQLIQYTVLEIHFWSLKYWAVIRLCKNLSKFPFLSKRCNAITMC